MPNAKASEFVPSTNDFFKTNGLPRSAHEVQPGGESLTRQEFAAECDINNLMKQYEGKDIGAIMRNVLPPVYYDFANAPSTLLEFMDVQMQAEAAFMTLPAVVRREFENDPMQFVEFAMNRDNLPQMRTWGLAKPEDAPVASREPANAPAAPGAPAAGPTAGAPPAPPEAPHTLPS